MGFIKDFFSRSGRVARGQLNAAMTSVEESTFESTLKQTIKDMKSELGKVIRASAEAMSNTNRLEAEYNKYIAQSKDWAEKAKKALKAGNEDLARKALAKKAEADTQVSAMKQGVETSRQTTEQLKKNVADLRRRISEAERNAGTLIARKNAARAQRKVAEAMSGVGEADNAFAALKSFEDSVHKEESAAKAYETLSLSEDDELAKEFQELDVNSVDAEMEKLKKEMKG